VRLIHEPEQRRDVLERRQPRSWAFFGNKGADRFLLPSAYIEQTIRPRALGRFEDLLIATAESPAMLFTSTMPRSVAPRFPHPVSPLRTAERR
jgi:hypothetical protein